MIDKMCGYMKKDNSKKLIIIIVLLITCFLSIGFSAFQKQLLIDDSIFNVRLQVDGSTI